MDTENITNTSEKNSARRLMVDELLTELTSLHIREKKIKNAVEGLQETCLHESKNYEGTAPNGDKIYTCMDCKKTFYE